MVIKEMRDRADAITEIDSLTLKSKLGATLQWVICSNVDRDRLGEGNQCRA